MAVNNDLYQQEYRKIALERVRKNGLELKHIDRNSVYYEQIVREAIRQNPLAIKHVKVSEPFYNELASLVVSRDPSLIKHIDKKATNYATLAKTAVSKDVKLLKSVDKKHESYKSLAYETATNDPSAKKYVKDNSVKQVIKLDGMDKSKKAKKYDKLAQKAVKTNLEAFKHIDPRTLEREKVEKAIRKNQEQLKYVTKDAALELLDYNKSLYESISPEHKKDKDFMIELVRSNSNFTDYSKIDKSLLDSEEFIIGVADRRPKVMEHASSRLKDNKEFILGLVAEKHEDYKYEIAQYASERLLSQKDFVSKTGTLYFASDDLRSDRKYVLDYMKKYSVQMGVASDSLKNDKDFVLHCINNTKYGAANLDYASAELKDDKEVIIAALKKEEENRGYSVGSNIGKTLRADREFMLEMIKDYNMSAYYASYELQEDRAFMKEAITLNGHNFNSLGENLRDDKELALLAIEKKGASAVMRNMGKKLKKDKEVFRAAAKSDVYSLEYADRSLLKNKKFALSLIGEVSSSIAKYLESDTNFLNDKKFMLAAIEKDIRFYNEINKDLRKDKKFMAKAGEIYDRKYQEEMAEQEEKSKQEEIKAQNQQEEQKVEKEENKKKKTTKKKETNNEEKEASLEVETSKEKTEEVVKEETKKEEVIENSEVQEAKDAISAEEKVEIKTQTKARASTKAMGSYDALSEENKAIYDKIMKKSFTNVFKSMTKEQETYLKGIYKEAYDKIKVKDPKEYTPEDVQVVALLTKITKKKVQAQGTVNKSNDEIKKMMDDKVKEKKATSSSR